MTSELPSTKSVVVTDAVQGWSPARVSTMETPLAGSPASPNGADAVYCACGGSRTRLPRSNGLAAEYGVVIVRVPDVSDTFTVCDAGADVGWVAVNATWSEVEPLYDRSRSATNCAVTWCVPTANVLDDRSAPDAVRGAVPRTVAPSRNFTDPVPAASAEESERLGDVRVQDDRGERRRGRRVDRQPVVVAAAGVALTTNGTPAEVEPV